MPKKSVRLSLVEQQWKPVLDLAEKGRLRRGKLAARQGDVVELRVSGRGLSARVRGGFSHGTFDVEIPSFADWSSHMDSVARWFARRPDWLGSFLSGEWSKDWLSLTERAGLRLFPDAQAADRIRWEAKCSCQDWEPLCPHILATIYRFIMDLEREPLTILNFVGLSVEAVLDRAHVIAGELLAESIDEGEVWTSQTADTSPAKGTAADMMDGDGALLQEAHDRVRGRFIPVMDADRLQTLRRDYMAWNCGSSSSEDSSDC